MIKCDGCGNLVWVNGNLIVYWQFRMVNGNLEAVYGNLALMYDNVASVGNLVVTRRNIYGNLVSVGNLE